MGHTSDDEDDGKRIGQPTDLALPNDNEPGRQISYAARIGVHSRVPDRSRPSRLGAAPRTVGRPRGRTDRVGAAWGLWVLNLLREHDRLPGAPDA